MGASPPTLPLDRFETVGGVRLHAVDWGGDGPPAVLLHATGFHARLWDPIARALSRRFHVYCLDARGHGDSDKPENGYDWPVLIEDVSAWMDALGLRGALGVGHSLGATTVAGAAAARPDLFTHLALLDMILFPREWRGLAESDNPMAVAARKRREVWPGREVIFASYRPRVPFDTWREEILRLYVDHGTEPAIDGAVRLKCPGRIEAQVFGMSSGFDGWAVLEHLEMPVLFVRGESSNTLSERDSAQALGRLRRGRLLTMSGTTHFIPMEAPERVVAAIEEFVAAVEPPPRLPVATRGLAHVALNARNLEAMLAFYQEVFGMRIVWQPDPDNVYLSSGRDNLALHRAADRNGDAGALDHLGFLVDRPADVWAAAEALAARGLSLLTPPKRHRDGSCSLYVKDPDGNVVQILYTPDAR